MIILVEVDRKVNNKLPTMVWCGDWYIGVAIPLFGVDGVIDGDGWSTTDTVVGTMVRMLRWTMQ